MKTEEQARHEWEFAPLVFDDRQAGIFCASIFTRIWTELDLTTMNGDDAVFVADRIEKAAYAAMEKLGYRVR